MIKGKCCSVKLTNWVKKEKKKCGTENAYTLWPKVCRHQYPQTLTYFFLVSFLVHSDATDDILEHNVIPILWQQFGESVLDNWPSFIFIAPTE